MNINARFKNLDVPAPPGYVDKHEAARMLGMHPKAMLRAIQRKSLKIVRHRQKDLEHLLPENEYRPSWAAQRYVFDAGEVKAEADARRN